MSKVKTTLSLTALALFAAASTPSIAQSGDQGLCYRFVEQCDADMDGQATLTEHAACPNNVGPDVFAAIDANQDGFITCPEVIIWFNS